MTGGLGDDTFEFRLSSGTDQIIDFKKGVDQIRLLDGISVSFVTNSDVNGEGIVDTTLGLRGGIGFIQILGLEVMDTTGLLIV
jgi:hypothetical protein